MYARRRRHHYQPTDHILIGHNLHLHHHRRHRRRIVLIIYLLFPLFSSYRLPTNNMHENYNVYPYLLQWAKSPKNQSVF